MTVTRLEVHLSDQNGGKSGQRDKRCVMEARLEGRQPIAASDDATTLDQAVRGAADKLARLIDSQAAAPPARSARRTGRQRHERAFAPQHRHVFVPEDHRGQ